MNNQTLDNSIVSTLRLASGAECGAGNNSPANMLSSLDGYSYSVSQDQLIASKDGFQWSINPLAVVARLALAIPKIKPDALHTGQLLDKLVAPSLAITPFIFKTDGTTAKKPNPGHYMTAAEFEASSQAEFCTLQGTKEHVYSVLSSLSDKDSKAKILADIATLLGTIPDERLETIREAYRKEEAVAFASTELQKYLNDVKIVDDKHLTGVYKPDLDKATQAEFSKLLVQEYASYTILPVPAVMSGFDIVTPACVAVTVTLK